MNAGDCWQMCISQNSQKKSIPIEKSETAIFYGNSLHIRWFSQISVIKIELSTGETDFIMDKKSHSTFFLQFLE